MGYIAGIQDPNAPIFDPGAALKNTPGVLGGITEKLNELTGKTIYNPYGGEGATKIGGTVFWKPGKRDEFIKQQLDAQGFTNTTDRLTAQKNLEGVQDPDKIKSLLGNVKGIQADRAKKEVKAKQEAQSIDQKLFGRQTGLMDRSFGYQKSLAQMQGQQGIDLANVNARNQLQLAGINAQNALQMADKQTKGQLAIQGLQNQGQYKISDLTSGRQLQASKMQSIANLLTPAGSSFRGLGYRTLQ